LKKKTDFRWLIRVTLISLVASIVFTLASTEILGRAGYILSFVVLAVFILIGVIFDVIGIAVATGNEAPFHSMATRRQKGAPQALKLIKNADRVTSYCNDVIGDVTGIVSGTTAALIAARLIDNLNAGNIVLPLIISALATGLTWGGKAIGKTLAFNNNTGILLGVGKVLSFLRINPFSKQDKKDKKA
jgi:CBS domain containing-hemolysin-like protein